MTKPFYILITAILMLLISFQAIAQEDGAAPEAVKDSGLASEIADKLDISLNKARGGAGAIFAYAEDQLDSDDFNDLADSIPEMDSLLDAAPQIDRNSRFGRMSRRLRDADRSRGGLAGLAASFEELNMDPGIIGKFLPVMYDFLDSSSGERATKLLQDVFPNGY